MKTTSAKPQLNAGHYSTLPFTSPSGKQVVSVKVGHLRKTKQKYPHLEAWLKDSNNAYIGRRDRVFIHTETKAKEDPLTKSNGHAYKDGACLEDLKVATIHQFPKGSFVKKNGTIAKYFRVKASKFANPFPVKKYGLKECLDKYADYLKENPELVQDAIQELGNKTRLGCWCRPHACHGQLLLTAMESRHVE